MLHYSIEVICAKLVRVNPAGFVYLGVGGMAGFYLFLWPLGSFFFTRKNFVSSRSGHNVENLRADEDDPQGTPGGLSLLGLRFRRRALFVSCRLASSFARPSSVRGP